MEPISGYWAVDIMVAITLYFTGAILFGKYLKGDFSHIRFGREPEDRPPPPERRHVAKDPGVLYGLGKMLENARIEGDFEYRNGQVHLPIPPSRLRPLANMLDNAAAHVARQRNPASISIYFRDSVQDKFHLMPEIDFDVIREAASVMRRVAADRDLSQRLYEGMTEDEMISMSRAILYAHWNRRGCPEIANKHRSGTEDNSPQARLVVETIQFLYSVKGVKPQ